MRHCTAAGLYSIIGGKVLSDSFLIHELREPPQPGPEQDILAIDQIGSFKIQIKARAALAFTRCLFLAAVSHR